jgi:hypothetical protein
VISFARRPPPSLSFRVMFSGIGPTLIDKGRGDAHVDAIAAAALLPACGCRSTTSCTGASRPALGDPVGWRGARPF